jgi:hypothetical protein
MCFSSIITEEAGEHIEGAIDRAGVYSWLVLPPALVVIRWKLLVEIDYRTRGRPMSV